MAGKQWARQWAKMERLEADLAGAADDPTATAAAAPAPAASRRDSVRGSAAPHAALAQQLQKHLTSLEALRAAAASAGASGPALERRLEACSAAQAQLERACAAQLAELRREEQQAAAEFEAAAQSIQDMQTAQPPPPQQPGAPRPAGQHNSAAAGCGATPPSASSDLPPEVTACDAFMQRHGPTGGWHPDDHAEFLRILRACRGSLPHCLQLCAHELGLLHGPEDVAAHARWYEELERLQLEKRLAVQRWRVRRQAQRASLLEEQEAAAAAHRDAEAQAEAAARACQAQREQQRAAVLEWKRARERAAQAERQRRQAEERERRLQEQAARAQRQQENLQLQQRRREEEAAAAEQAQARPSKEGSKGSGVGAAADPAARQRLRERNEQLLARRAAQAARKGQQDAAHAERLTALQRRASEQFAGVAERDPGRLLATTSTAAMRQLALLSEERAAKDSGYIRHLPRRATPSWCAGARMQ